MRHGPLLVPFAFAVSTVFATCLPAQQVEWWQKDLESGLAASADSEAKLLLLYCFRDPDGNCSAMFSGTMSDEKVTPVLATFVCMGAKQGDEAGKELQRRFHVEQLPTTLFLTPEGKVVDVIAGYVPVAEFLAEVDRIKKGDRTLAALREAAAAKPDDLALQLDYMRKLRATGDKPGSLQVIEAIVAKDPKCRKEPAAEAMLLRLTDEVFPPDSSPQSWDVEPLHAFLRQQKNKRVLFLGYRRLAEAAYLQEDLKNWAKFSEHAWKSIPAEEVKRWGQEHATIACRHGKELDAINKAILKLSLKISEKAFEVVEKEQAKAPDKPFLAYAMYLHAGVLKANGKRKEAFKLLDDAIAADPNNKDLKAAKDWWVQGN
ncbi:MAG: hypothetical protein KDC98_10880 [Planctomycetes bacterium]|nr:hypothetical protein [Planctomycetota bacterium]